MRDELARILYGPEPGQKPGGLGSVRFIATCPGKSDTVLARSREIMQIILGQPMTGDYVIDVTKSISDQQLSTNSWRKLFPRWFIERFRKESTREEAEREIRLPFEEQKRIEEREGWEFSAWIYWYHPQNRHWYWWDAAIVDANTVYLAVEVNEWPFPWGGLKWLFKASGATDLVAEKDK